MPDDQDQQTDAPPPWLQQLGATLHQQSQQIAELRQTVHRATQPQAAPQPQRVTPTAPVAETRARILDGLVNEPERVIAEIVGYANQSAEQRLNERLLAERQMAAQSAQQQALWGQFYAANPDMQGLQAEVWSRFQNVDPSITDFSARANEARNSVRAWIEQVVQMAHQQEKQAADQRRLLAGAPGGPGMGPMLDPVAEAQDEVARTTDALADRRAHKAARMGHLLRDDQAYHEERRQDALRKKGAQAQRRAG